MSRARKSIGTLGGGNHFIEINEDEEHFYIVIHSGSRHLGLEIEAYYTNKAQKILKQINVEEIVKKAKAEGNGEKIQELLAQENEMKEKYSFAYLEGELFDDYINDMKTTQEFAYWNRKAILETLTTGIRTPEQFEEINTIHNYVDTGRMIIRKGAVSANKKEKLIIPINMRDGSLICVGKGNEDWNWSAPHGAGRILSRTQAEKQLKLEDFQETMKGVWTTSVGENTLSEAPMAYKPMEEIIANIGDTVEILSIVKPLYNFKAPEEDKFWKKKRN
jgi:RNA-splicing ligase RtcB